MTRQISKTLKRTVPLILAIMLIASAMFVPTVVSANTETDTNYGLHLAETIDFTKYASIGDSLDGNSNQDITSDTLPLGATGSSATQTVYYNVYGDISTLSYDVYLDSTADNAVFPTVYYYIDDANSTNNWFRFSFDVNATEGNRLRYTTTNTGAGTITKGIDFASYRQNWITVKLEYSNETEIYTRDALGVQSKGKYIKKITIIDRATGTELYSFVPYATNGSAQYYWHYGVNTYSDATLTDSDAVKIGFATASAPATIQNLSVTYRNNASKVIGYIDAIGDVEATDECLAKIVFAEEAYALLTDTEKAAVTNYATLTAARASYIDLTENADVAAVIEKIDAIGTVDSTDECLAKIVAAEEAYAALAPEKQAKVTNYATLTAARASYNNLIENADVTAVIEKIDAIGAVDGTDECLAKIKAAEEAYAALTPEKQAKVTNYSTLVEARAEYKAAKYGVHADETIDFTEYASVSGDFEGMTAESLPLSAKSGNYADSVYYEVYGDISTLSYDIYVDSDATTGSVNFPIVYHYVDDANSVSDSLTLYLDTHETNGNRIRYNSKSISTIANGIDHRAFLQKWLTVKLEYSNEDETYTYSSSAGKYIKKITIIDRESNTELASMTPSSDYEMYTLHYGVNTYSDATLTDSDAVKIGFKTNGVASTIENVSVTYRNTAAFDAVSEINDITVDNSAACAEQIADIEATYALLPESAKTAELTAKIAEAKETLEVVESATAENLPVMDGASIRITDATKAQNIRFNSIMPTAAIDGWSIVEYGTVIFPTQLLAGQELTLNTSNGDQKVASGCVQVEEDIPLSYTSELNGIDVSGTNCGVRVSARSYVKYSDGTNEFILYSTNDKAGYSEATPTAGINKGVANRSVFGTARTMAKAVLDTATYSEATYGSINGTLDIDTATGAEVLTFVCNNQARITKIALAQQQ